MDSVLFRLEKLAKDGLFGEVNVLEVRPALDSKKSAQFQSQLGFFELAVETQGHSKIIPVVAKLQLQTVSLETINLANRQFATEVLAYERILPALGATELGLHPKSYFGQATQGKDPTQDLLILEDLRPQGFKVPQAASLDNEHIQLALKKLGQFHGLSYKLKNLSPDEFNKLKHLLTPKHVWDGDGYIETSILRGFQKDLELFAEDSVFKKAYKKLTGIKSKVLIEKLSFPEEPYAVIVHGDFLKNNVLYKYDANEKPQDLKIFDFQTAMYSDPTIDLAVFLYMHTSDRREEHWEDHLRCYWDGLMSTGQIPFSYQEFKKNFSKKAVYGYLISAFFLPFMQHPEKVFQFDQGFPDKPKDEKMELARNYGGEESTAAITSIVRHLYNEGYLEEYLLNFEQ